MANLKSEFDKIIDDVNNAYEIKAKSLKGKGRRIPQHKQDEIEKSTSQLGLEMAATIHSLSGQLSNQDKLIEKYRQKAETLKSQIQRLR